MIKVSDFVFKWLHNYGIKDVFMISGGGAMHLVDSLGRCRGINYICTSHEQAAAIAAEGYSRVSGKLGVVLVTSGPGGTNTITGVIGQWLDSIPALYISGQVKQTTTINSCKDIKLRQLGDQEINIVDIVKPITKYAVLVNNPNDILYHLEKAVYLATHGRPGPVWLDIPLDIQCSIINESKLTKYKEKIESKGYSKQTDFKIQKVIDLLKLSKRPLFVAGHGIRISKAIQEFNNLINRLHIPVVTSFNGFDLIETDNRLYIGRIGTIGDRTGNFVLQNADLIISVGSRNNIRQVSYNWQSYAKNAKKIIVDIDENELNKPTIKGDISICSDAIIFLNKLINKINNDKLPNWSKWITWCDERKRKYPVVLKEYAKTNPLVNPYYFINVLTERLKENSILVAGNGTACVATFQAGIVKKGQRIFWNSGCAAMGYDLPAAIGACFGSGKKDVVCLAGDGSLQMNIQEFETVVYHKLPIKIFVLNNSGYNSIKQTQDSYFNNNYVGSNEKSGVGFPDFIKVAEAYGLPTETINSHKELVNKLDKILKTPGPIVCEIKLISNYIFSPKLSSEKRTDGSLISKPLEDMYPFLKKDELESNMIILNLDNFKKEK